MPALKFLQIKEAHRTKKNNSKRQESWLLIIFPCVDKKILLGGRGGDEQLTLSVSYLYLT